MKIFDVATVIVNYKTEERTIEFITQELCKCSIRNLIVIVNNQATETSTGVLADAMNAEVVYDVYATDVNETSNQIYVIHNAENSGFARGNNLGVEFIKHHFVCNYLLFSNNDIRLQSNNVIECLICKLKTLPDVGIIGPKVVGLDGRCQSPNDYVPFWKEMVLVPWERFIPFLRLRHIDQDNAKEGFYFRVMGSFFLMRYDDFINCGMMDPVTFLFYEEAILSERLRLLNKHAYYYPEVTVVHDHGYSVNKVGNTLGKRDFMFESAVYFFTAYKGVSDFNIMIVKCLHYIYNNLQNLKRKFYVYG